MTVYADVLFFMNFAFDIEILFLLFRLYSKKIPPVRLLLSACLGGAQGLFAFIPYFGILFAPPARFLMPLLMVMAVFLPCKQKECLGAWGCFMIISFVFNGAVNFLQIKAVWGLFLLAPICAAIGIVKRNVKRKKSTAVLIYGDRKITEEGFFDSGNMLSYSGVPVILASRRIFEKLFGTGFTPEAAREWADIKDIRLIPYSTIGKKGAILGIRLDACVVNGKRYDNVILGHFGEEISEDLILNGIMT